MSFENKTVVVSGGAKGIGEGCAQVFHRQGGNVVFLDTDKAAGERLQEDFSERALFLECDVSKEDKVKHAIAQAADTFGSLDVLVNNAGIMPYSTVTETSAEDWDRVMAVNVKGAFLCSKYAIPHMMEAGEGAVINMSSVQAFATQENVAPYVTSKSALIGLTRSIAVDYAPQVRSVAICPGGVDTPLNRAAFQESADPEQVRQETIDLHLVDRMAKPEEIGELVAFICSEKGSFINGQPIRIDGGLGVRIAGSKKA